MELLQKNKVLDTALNATGLNKSSFIPAVDPVKNPVQNNMNLQIPFEEFLANIRKMNPNISENQAKVAHDALHGTVTTDSTAKQDFNINNLNKSDAPVSSTSGPTNLFEYYSAQGKPLPSIQERIQDPNFQQALQKAGMTTDQYLALGTNNKDANEKILPFLLNPQEVTADKNAGITKTDTTTTDTSNKSVSNTGGTGDANLDALNKEREKSLSDISLEYSKLNTTLANLATGSLKLAPEEQQYITAMQSTAASAASIAAQAAAAQTGMVKYNLAKTGQTRSSPAVAASQIALTVQAGANAIQDINNKANLAIAQFEQGIRTNQIKSARDAYDDFTKAQKDRTDTLESMYKDINDHEKDIRDYNYKVQKDISDRALEKEKYDLEIAKFNHTLDVDAGSGIGAITPEALDILSRGYLTSGNLPSFGNGKQAAAMKAAVVNRAVELSGGNANVNPALNHSMYTANSNALKQQTSNLTTAQTAFNIFDKNGQLALSLAQGLNQSNSPIVNQLSNKVINQTTGQGQLDSFRALITSLQAEYATLISVKGGAGGVTTDSDKAKAVAAIPDNISPKRLAEVLTNLKKEGTNVLNERRQTIEDLQKNISDAGSTFNQQVSDKPLVGQINIAKSAGYSSDQIVAGLINNPKYNSSIVKAQSAGYSSDDIINFLEK